MVRILLYPKDLCTIAGKSEKQARALIKKIQTEQNREGHPFTVFDLSEYLKKDVTEVVKLLKLNH
jgi:hypothetical protein